MKNSAKRILRAVLAIFVIVFFEGGVSYFSNHSYYGGMFAFKNFGLILAGLGAAAIPLWYLKGEEKPDFGGLILRVGAGLLTFNILHELIAGTLLGIKAGFLLSWNTLLLFTIAVGVFLAIFVLGVWLTRVLKFFQNIQIRELLLSFGVGLVAFLVVIQLLMGLGILYWPLVLVLLILIAGIGWMERGHLYAYYAVINDGIKSLSQKLKGRESLVLWALLAGSLMYFFFGFNHSLIPYPTARDANHEYIYTPKVIAENAGILWGNNGAGASMPYLWHAFITFAFVLRKGVGLSYFSADTFAVNMNFWSGILVLLFGLASIAEALKFFGQNLENKEEKRQISPFYLAWGLLLAWLSSGMGAFLLFVDNKTDMGVLSLTVLALFAGMSFINLMQGKEEVKSGNSSLVYLLISAALFAFAVIAKPTAFIDVVVFSLLLMGLRVNSTAAIGTGVMTFGMMGILQPLYATAFLNPLMGKVIFAVGLLIFVIGTIRALFSKKAQLLQGIKYLMIWGGVFLVTIVLFKGPWVAYHRIISNNQDWASFPKTLILGMEKASVNDQKRDQKSDFGAFLLANADNPQNIIAQSEVDTAILDQQTSAMSLAQCQANTFDQLDLEAGLQKAPGSTLREDFGRYVGFNGRGFSRSGVMGLLLKIAFWNEGCYGLNKDALLLCENRSLLDTPSLENLKTLQDLYVNRDGKVKAMIESGFALSGIVNLDQVFSDLDTYYQEHSILAKADEVVIPYRYLVPVNAVFNWSLQNLSSYYTDIGLIWIFVLILLVGALMVSIIKRKKNLITLLSAVGIGWVIRWAIAAGIVRYGLGLMIWLIIAVVAFMQEQLQEAKKSDASLGQLVGRIVMSISFLIFLQLMLNFLRISSQAGSGPFGWYKASFGQEQVFGNGFTDVKLKEVTYDAEDVFGLQFGQYSPVIDALKDRKDEDGVLIAGTYLQYFLHNQKNVKLDGLLSWLWEQMSDYNSCKSYHRLDQQHIKYLVIDPNIGTVGRVGAGNESLFHRFFAKLDEKESQIQTHGAMTMLARFVQDGYAKLFFTNNIGAKYAFELTNDELKEAFGEMSNEQLVLLRAKLSVAKFFISQQDMTLLEEITELALKRFASVEGMDDFANLLNKKVDAEKLYQRVDTYLKTRTGKFEVLNSDEKVVVYQYLVFLQMLQSGEGQSQFARLIQESVFGSSQLIALEME